MNFQSNQEEVSLTVSPEKLAVKNYTDDEPGTGGQSVVKGPII